jgi:hypothetical protein
MMLGELGPGGAIKPAADAFDGALFLEAGEGLRMNAQRAHIARADYPTSIRQSDHAISRPHVVKC